MHYDFFDFTELVRFINLDIEHNNCDCDYTFSKAEV